MPKHRVYHISHVKNFMSIVTDRALRSRNALVESGKLAGIETFADLAEPDIVKKRAQKRVPLPPGGHLTDYVPFFFQPFPPMLYALLHRNPKPLLMHFLTTVERLAEAGIPFVFTDRHAINQDCRFFNRLGDLEELEWSTNLGRTRDARGEQAKLIRQAEFLVYNQVPLELIQEIILADAGRARSYSKILRDEGFRIGVRAAKQWYDV